jgi:D-3-phosphoglycerate dehydrogenase
MISHITSTLADDGINIENMANRSKGDYACTLVGTNAVVDDKILSEISGMEGIIRVIKIAK